MKLQPKRLRWWSSAFAVLLLALLVTPVLAGTFDGKDAILVAKGETIDDNLYAAADEIRIEGRVTGDLICGARSVMIAPGGRVDGDLMCGAQQIHIDGSLGGDLRSAGFVLRIGPEGEVEGELLGAGFSIELAPGAKVGGDAWLAGAQGLIDGELGEDLKFAGGALEINGSVAGDVDAEVGSSADGRLDDQLIWTKFVPDAPTPPERLAKMGIAIGPSAKIGGDLSYRSAESFDTPASAVGGSIRFEEQARPITADSSASAAAPVPQRSPLATWMIKFFQRFVALAIFGLLLARFTPRSLAETTALASDEPLPSAGWGCLTLILSVTGLIALAIGSIFALVFFSAIRLPDLIGPTLSSAGIILVVLTAGLSLLGWYARVAVADWIGRSLAGQGFGSAIRGRRYLELMAGLSVFALVATAPYVGPVFDLVALLVGLGASVTLLWHWAADLRASAQVTVTDELV
jgi:cytoskeletal protein CcmA (bactofilin family)